MIRKIKVKNSGLIKLQLFSDKPDGDLYIAESFKSVPFNIRRIYYINNLSSSKAVRGLHAHKKLEQYIFCVNGSFELHLDDGWARQNIFLNDPSIGVRLGAKLWHEMKNFSKDCVILVLANDYFKKNDYIRNYQEFLKYVKNKKN